MATGPVNAVGRDARDPTALPNARVFVAWVTVVAVYFDPTEPTHYGLLVYSLLVLYAVYAGVIALVIERRQTAAPQPYEVAMHAVDVAVAALLTLFTEGISSPFFVYFGFILIAAAWRWGFWATIGTACALLLLLLAEALLASQAFQPSLIELGPFDLSRYIVRNTYVIVLAVVVGHLAEANKRARVRAAAIARIIATVPRAGRFAPSVACAAEQVLRLYKSPRLVLIASEASEGRRYLWDSRLDPATKQVTLHSAELDQLQYRAYRVEAPAQPWLLRRSRRSETGWELFVQRTRSADIRTLRFSPPEAVVIAHTFNVVVGTTCRISDEWVGELLLFDPAVRLQPAALIDGFDTLVQNVAPSIYNVFLLRRLRSRARAVERARVARELHDRVLQSLIGAEMQIDALRRSAVAASDSRRIAEVQQHLRDEVAGLRDLMDDLSPMDVRPQQLVSVLRDTVERFERQTGIRARFTTNLDIVAASPAVCREVVSIVREALTNVRKHSGARNAIVRLMAADGAYQLVIEDDGRGFGFFGNKTLAQLDADLSAPRVLSDRVRGLGGGLTIVSTPGEGARVEIAVPLGPHAA